MNPEAKLEFDRITEIDPESLTPFELDFLYARRTYLNKTKKEVYKDVIAAKDEAVKAAANPEA